MGNFLEALRERTQSSIGFSLILGILLFFLGQMLIVLLVEPIRMGFGFTYDDINRMFAEGLLQNDTEKYFFRIIQGCNQFAVWGFAGLAMAWLLGKPRETLALKMPKIRSTLLIAPLVLMASTPLIQFLNFDAESFRLPEFLAGLEASMKEREMVSQLALSSLFVEPGVLGLLVNLLVFAVAPAICEELFFRGFFQRQLSRQMPAHTAVWLSALLFSIIHMQFYGLFTRLVLGAMLGYFLLYSRSLFPSILAHFCFNALPILLAFWLPETVEAEYAFSPTWVLLSAALTGALFFLFQNVSTSSPRIHE
ncbi:MAG: CPBP family intramembrane glutamic endopeptidase [Bacteroidota bacterium]